MEATKLDRFGRVLIPKPIRDAMGIKPGAVLLVEEHDQGIVLKPADRSPPLKVKGHVLVFAGEAQGDLQDAIRRQREERMRTVAGMDES